MKINAVLVGLEAFHRCGLNLVFTDGAKPQLFVPCAAPAAEKIQTRYRVCLKASSWTYDPAIEAFVLEDA